MVRPSDFKPPITITITITITIQLLAIHMLVHMNKIFISVVERQKELENPGIIFRCILHQDVIPVVPYYAYSIPDIDYRTTFTYHSYVLLYR